MRTRLTIVLLVALLTGFGCGKGGQINASSNKSLYRSVTSIRDRLPEKQRVEFEVAFWSLKRAEPDQARFRDSVNGKSASEIIAMGKANFDKQKAAGNEDYQKHASWDAMIDALVTERQETRVYGQSRKDQQNQLQMNR